MTTAPVSALPQLQIHEGTERRSNLILQLGGVLWIVYYATQLLMGFAYGDVKNDGPLGILAGVLFLGAIFCFSVGLSLLARSLWTRAWTARVALLFAFLAGVGVVGSIGLVITGRPSGIFGGIGVISTCLSTVFVALAARRAKIWSARRGWLLLLIGALTFPLILLFIIPGQYVPGFLTDELPFALSGAAFIAFARMSQKA